MKNVLNLLKYIYMKRFLSFCYYIFSFVFSPLILIHISPLETRVLGIPSFYWVWSLTRAGTSSFLWAENFRLSAKIGLVYGLAFPTSSNSSLSLSFSILRRTTIFLSHLLTFMLLCTNGWSISHQLLSSLDLGWSLPEKISS